MMTSTSWKPSYSLEIEGLVAHKHKLEAENAWLRDLLAFNGIDPDATVESAKGAAAGYVQERGNNSSEGGNGDEALPSSVQSPTEVEVARATDRIAAGDYEEVDIEKADANPVQKADDEGGEPNPDTYDPRPF